MAIKELDGKSFKAMVSNGADNLAQHAEMINALNVFPVPDGDTGTNMNLSMSSGIKELKQESSDEVGKIADALARGLLMGARGNSGVILSQLFRGFSRSLSGKTVIHAKDLARALESGVDTAFKAVIKPVEGTILTVAKDAANRALQVSRKETDVTVVMDEVVQAARKSLKNTPELLPVLKEAGVIDSGGQGLVIIYEGFLAGLTGDPLPDDTNDAGMDEMINAVHHKKAQLDMKTEDIEYGYCTEFMVRLEDQDAFDEEKFRGELAEHGDSLLVASDADWVKVHIHTETPGDMLTYGQRYGSLNHIKIDNMRRQHEDILREDKQENTRPQQQKPKQPYGFVTVAAGSGMKKLFESLGATVVIEGGQTMNPSTEDLVSAVRESDAKHVFILPNNGNIVMAAQQAKDVVDQQVSVIPTKTIPQGIAAFIAFNPETDVETNGKRMAEAAEHVKSGQITFAVRDTQKDGLNIKKGDYIAISGGEIIAADKKQAEAAKQLLGRMISEEDDIVTLIYGEEAGVEEAEELATFVEERFPDMEVEIHEGGQPVYSYIVSVE